MFLARRVCKCRCLGFVCAVVVIMSVGPPALGQEKKDPKLLFVPVKNDKGEDTPLYRKVIVRSDKATLHDEPGTGAGVPVEAFSIFFQLKADDGQEKKGDWIRVAHRKGQPLGWIKEEHLVFWNTRFILEPLPPKGNRVFEVFNPTDKDAKGETLARVTKEPKGKNGIAPILDKPENEKDPIYKIAFFAGKRKQSVAPKPAIPQEETSNPLKDFKMEIFFVIDTTQSMDDLIDGTKKLVEDFSKELEAKPDLKPVIRFGLVQYQDKVQGLIPSQMICPLTSDIAAFRKALTTLKAATLSSVDAPESGLAGLLTALQGAHEDGKLDSDEKKKPGWTTISTKHIILVGDASHHEGSHPKNAAGGLTIKTFVDRCRKSSGNSDERTLGSVNLHAIRAMRDGYGPEEIQICRSQFQELARNNGEYQGFYDEVNPNDQTKVDALLKRLAEKMIGGAKTTASIAKTGGLPEGANPSNEFEASCFEIVGTQGKADINPVKQGFAPIKNKDGEVVAQEKIFVFQDELKRLHTTLKSLHIQFKDLADPKEREGVDSVLTNLQLACGLVVTGQTLRHDTNLEVLFTNLPLKTTALKTTPKALATLARPDFEVWLASLNTAAQRAQDLLDQSDWNALSNLAEKDKKEDLYTWLHKSQMP